MVDFYLTTMRTQVQTQFQYRATTYMYLVGMVAEPVIYLVVWTTIADSHGGSVQGITSGEFAAYYIVWTLIPHPNLRLGYAACTGASVTFSGVRDPGFRAAGRHKSSGSRRDRFGIAHAGIR
jgi:hypothetical protein